MNLFPLNVKLISTERIIEGGRSLGSFNNFNLALHVNDNKEDVLSNRSLLRDYYDLPSDPVWLNQTHSSICLKYGKAEASYHFFNKIRLLVFS